MMNVPPEIIEETERLKLAMYEAILRLCKAGRIDAIQEAELYRLVDDIEQLTAEELEERVDAAMAGKLHGEVPR